MLRHFKNKPLYNGTVNVDGTKVPVKNCVCEYEGKQYFVSKDGKYVMDMNRQVIAKIIKGNLTPLEKSDVTEMRQMGIIATPKQQNGMLAQ